MSYFSLHAEDISLSFDGSERPGLREAQLGAIHALAAHFIAHPPSTGSLPALVVMPTGSGKTAVMLTIAFLLRASRVLLVSPSRAVRDQLAREASTLETLKRLRVVPQSLVGPHVCEVPGRVATLEAWCALEQYDLVVGTPNSLSPASPGVAPAPPLFDLVIVDEAHHSPARTWKAILGAFPDARAFMMTATPFRLDEREIRARTVFDYPLDRALDDHIVCPLEYMPVEVARGEDPDETLARRAAEVLRRKQAENPAYRLLVRTDRIEHAAELQKTYTDATDLRLRTVHSGHSEHHITRSIEHLRKGDLDGIICVDMLGEGFDFPPLKVAAIHRKHKSLPVTLQFVGRFGRVTHQQVEERDGERAWVLAVPEELEGEIQRLYNKSTGWDRFIPNLHRARIERLQETQRLLETFEIQPLPSAEQLETVSLWAFKPLAHVKVYEVEREVDVDIAREVLFEAPTQVVYRAVSPELAAQLFVTRGTTRPDWARKDVSCFDQSEHDLFVIHWNSKARQLFICASKRGSIELYEWIARQLTGLGAASDDAPSRHRLLPLHQIDRVLRGQTDGTCFNVGMRNRLISVANESYRILAGPEVDRAVRRSDGRMYHRGHVFIGIPEEDRTVTLGYSSASKIWWSKHMDIPGLISWCDGLAAALTDEAPFTFGGNLDFLRVGEPLTFLPDDLIGAAWSEDVFLASRHLVFPGPDGQEKECELRDTAWRIERARRTGHSVPITLEADGQEWTVLFTFDAFHPFAAGPDPVLPRVRTSRETVPLLSYLASAPIDLYTSDFARVRGQAIFRRPETLAPFDVRCFRPVTWLDVRIDRELRWSGEAYTPDGFDLTTVQGFLAAFLLRGEPEVLFYDHGSGEIADFVAVGSLKEGDTSQFGLTREDSGAVHVTLFHVKATKKSKKQSRVHPSARVDDAYEVCGQVVKSLAWLHKRTRLLERIQDRSGGSSFFLRGDLATLRGLLLGRDRQLRYHVALVQPGLSLAAVQKRPDILEVLAATDDFVRRAVDNPVIVLCSQ
ncbi:MAG TPA: DEAD/DEAH box helicase family protein [Thermoanaerobaculaceae bacterium]|nr:DEAD/DEAH box helicase family protein [Thermoanaerobaculaceae bacterium]HPS77266.1 DEAD/DEAH box helicase family protein [Thermoanaerobaculaceae bacterium]